MFVRHVIVSFSCRIPQLRDVVPGQRQLVPFPGRQGDEAQHDTTTQAESPPSTLLTRVEERRQDRAGHPTLPPRFPGNDSDARLHLGGAATMVSAGGTRAAGGGGAGELSRGPPSPRQRRTITQQQKHAPVAPRDSENDPNFVANFFKQSRLHFIGSWRLRHSSIVQQICSANLHARDSGIAAGQTHGSVSADRRRRVVLHIDMDCFFAAVAVREEPSLRGLPLAICHGTGAPIAACGGMTASAPRPASTSEISAASYAARQHGIRAGMFLGRAYSLCPGLVVRGYRFDLYESITSDFFKLLLSTFSPLIEPVSCDEVFMDVTALVASRPPDATRDLLHSVKEKIFEVTGCVASVGCGRSKLVAKMASKKAKPDGIVDLSYLEYDDDDNTAMAQLRDTRHGGDRAPTAAAAPSTSSTLLSSFMREIPIRDLPGVGFVTASLLAEAGIESCADVMDAGEGVVENALSKGDPTAGGVAARASAPSSSSSRAHVLKQHARGIDDRPVAISNVSEGQSSIGAEINYGIRFKTTTMLRKFISDLAQEVVNRMKVAGVVGRTITVKVKRRRATAPLAPPKFLGHGVCDNGAICGLRRPPASLIISAPWKERPRVCVRSD